MSLDALDDGQPEPGAPADRPPAEPAALVERMIDVALNAARAEAVTQQVGPESVDAVDESGYPVLWAITWRARSAAWMVNNRATLARAVSG